MPLPTPSDNDSPLLTPADLEPFAAIDEAKATQMIADAVAMAALVAPCILTDGFAYPDAAKAILRGAVLRWNDSGSGAAQTQGTGPYSVTLDTRQQRRGMFWPSEIEQLQALCRGESSGAFSITPGQGIPGGHSKICALNFGAQYCSCGYELTRLFSLYERTDY